MDGDVAFIGFGEAGQAFAEGLGRPMRAYDRMTDVGPTRQAKLNDYARLCVDPALTNQAAVEGARFVLSLVTADKGLAAARETAHSIDQGTFFFDMNSVAPETKRAAVATIEAAGARYVDAAVMSPVYPAGRRAPLLVAGPHAESAAEALLALGFANVRIVAGPIGAASSIKMIRSVMVKGLEALSAECALAAHVAGVKEEVIASLDASWTNEAWADRFNYNLGRMMAHGTRRAAEMEEVVKTLDILRTGAAMSRGTIARQRQLGSIGHRIPASLDAKIALILERKAPVA